MKNFSISEFAQSCKESMDAHDDRRAAAHAHLEATLQQVRADQIIATLEEAIPDGADIGEMIVHSSPQLTLLYARVPGRFRSGIHNHTIFACIGQLEGAEMNTVYQPDADGLRVESTVTVQKGEVISLPEDAIHNIENPLPTVSRSLHLYGGDLAALAEERILWASEDHRAKPFSFPALLAESVSAMKQDGNDVGLAELAKAIPSVQAFMDA